MSTSIPPFCHHLSQGTLLLAPPSHIFFGFILFYFFFTKEGISWSISGEPGGWLSMASWVLGSNVRLLWLHPEGTQVFMIRSDRDVNNTALQMPPPPLVEQSPICFLSRSYKCFCGVQRADWSSDAHSDCHCVILDTYTDTQLLKRTFGVGVPGFSGFLLGRSQPVSGGVYNPLILEVDN